MNLNNFTIKASEVVQQAQQLAYNDKHPNIENEHLLKALLGMEDSPIDYLLKKNNVTVLAGRGPVSIDGKLVGNKVEADLKHDAVGAIQYTRRFDYLSGTIQLQTNESILLGIGLEF